MSATNCTEQESTLNEAMSSLETALLSPHVSGELKNWVHAVHKASSQLAEHLRPYIETILHTQYKEIARTDPELLSRVEQMIEADRGLLEEFSAFETDLANLESRVPGAEKDEGKVSEHRDRLEKNGTALVLHIKKQQLAASTWLAEAFYRDRGPVD